MKPSIFGNTRFSLSRNALKIIAIISMVIDHTAWGFVDLYSPLGQVLHVLGRLTIPIMCFFIAEGFKKTSNLHAYIGRMITFAIITIIPFYLFFHEEYDYRQNIIFDLLLGLLVLTTLESTLKKWAKIVIAVALFGISIAIGGWVVTPILFILAFYYGRTFKEKAKWFCIANISTVGIVVIGTLLNNAFQFLPRYASWVWWDKLYLLGFMLALPLIYCYNGEKGHNFGGKYFFYLFYPIHFLILFYLKCILLDGSFYMGYLYLHIGALLVMVFLLVQTIRSKPSKGQNSILLFEFSGLVYVAGFIIEILANTIEGYHLAIMVEYLGEIIVLIGLVYFTGLLCKIRIPYFVYATQGVLGAGILYMLATTTTNGFFYSQILITPFDDHSRLSLEYGPGFYMTISYIAIVSAFIIISCIITMVRSSGIERKRAGFIILGLSFMWVPYLVKLTGLTGGYEIPAVGIAISGVFFYLVLHRYGFLDSVSVASDYLLDHGPEGIMVLSNDYYLEFQNELSKHVVGSMRRDIDLRTLPLVQEILSERLTTKEVDHRIYEFKVEPLLDKKHLHGYMIWIFDSTDHYEALKRIQDAATKDSLTGIYNRNTFKEKLDPHLKQGLSGTLFMVDMDNFKAINDHYGHQLGDDVLISFARVISEYPQEALLGCRLGGDEFMLFSFGCEEASTIQKLIEELMAQFEIRLTELGYSKATSLSVGAILCKETAQPYTFERIYEQADIALYEAKQSGKNCYRIKDYQNNE